MSRVPRFLTLTAAVCLVATLASAQQVVCEGSGETQALIAGQNFYAGTITVTIDPDRLCVTYQTDGDWVITETHLAIADSLAGLPQNKSGNPQPGRFPYSATHTPPVTTFQTCVPLPAYTPIYIATHAVVQEVRSDGSVIQRQTAWAGPDPFPGKNWATYFVFNGRCREYD